MIYSILILKYPNLASKNLDRRIMTASHVLCFSCISMAANFRRMMLTMRSISLGATGRVRLCSRSKLTTWVVNSLHACFKREKGKKTQVKSLEVNHNKKATNKKISMHNKQEQIIKITFKIITIISLCYTFLLDFRIGLQTDFVAGIFICL